MVKRATKKKKRTTTAAGTKRRERRFTTSITFMPLWVAIVGMASCLSLGAGVFGLWIQDPPLGFANLLVAGGGLGLGVALWFGSPRESAVTVGDSGIAVDDGRQTLRVPWYDMSRLSIQGTMVSVTGRAQTIQFVLGANKAAAAYALKEAAVRVPDVVDVDQSVAKTLPDPNGSAGTAEDVEDDQVTGKHCASSNKLISMEEDARICPRCGQVFHKDSVPEECPTCQTALLGKVLLA